MHGVVSEALASRKVVSREGYTEVSETANSCTDKQEPHTRVKIEDEYPHQYEVQKITPILSRCGGDRRKDNSLTEGGLRNHELI